MLNYYKSQSNSKRRYVLILFLLIILTCLLIMCALLITNKELSNKYSTNNLSKIGKCVKKINLAKGLESNYFNKRESTIQPVNTKNEAGEVAPWTEKRNDGSKVAYLTFDDGPSSNTESILNTLDKYNVKATFFLVGLYAEKRPDLVKEEVNRGMSIGNHTYSHQLNYAEGPENFVKDLNRCDAVLKSICGPNCYQKLARFPGGSFGSSLIPFKNAATKAGYRYVDWNDGTDDAMSYNPSVPLLLSNLAKHTAGNTIVVLMHDAQPKTNTVEALPKVIENLKSWGYTFQVLK